MSRLISLVTLTFLDSTFTVSIVFKNTFLNIRFSSSLSGASLIISVTSVFFRLSLSLSSLSMMFCDSTYIHIKNIGISIGDICIFGFSILSISINGNSNLCISFLISIVTERMIDSILPRTSHLPPAGSRDGRTWPPSQRAAADPGPKHGENTVPCKETKPEIKIVRNTAFTTTTSLPTRETRTPPPWPTRSPPPSAAPASHGTPGTYEARGGTQPPQCSPPPYHHL